MCGSIGFEKYVQTWKWGYCASIDRKGFGCSAQQDSINVKTNNLVYKIYF